VSSPRRIPKTARGWVLGALLAVPLAGCGYHFVGEGRDWGPDVKTIGIQTFTNETREIGIEKRLQFALEREFTIRGPYRVADEPGAGDLVVSGTVRIAEDRPVAFNRDDEVLIYQTTLSLDLLVRDRKGKMVWQARDLRGVSDYESVASVIVTTSSQFRSSTLNENDLAGFTDIQLAESRRREAITRIVGSLARDVYDQFMEDF
jgi:hypothetical protein